MEKFKAVNIPNFKFFGCYDPYNPAATKMFYGAVHHCVVPKESVRMELEYRVWRYHRMLRPQDIARLRIQLADRLGVLP